MKLPPLLVHLLFHPDSDSARQLARHVHCQLNGDPIVPGLRIPTLFSPVEKEGAPTATLQTKLAARNFVVVLADDRLTIDDAWCSFCADIWASFQGTNIRFV